MQIVIYSDDRERALAHAASLRSDGHRVRIVSLREFAARDAEALDEAHAFEPSPALAAAYGAAFRVIGGEPPAPASAPAPARRRR